MARNWDNIWRVKIVRVYSSEQWLQLVGVYQKHKLKRSILGQRLLSTYAETDLISKRSERLLDVCGVRGGVK